MSWLKAMREMLVFWFSKFSRIPSKDTCSKELNHTKTCAALWNHSNNCWNFEIRTSNIESEQPTFCCFWQRSCTGTSRGSCEEVLHSWSTARNCHFANIQLISHLSTPRLRQQTSNLCQYEKCLQKMLGTFNIAASVLSYWDATAWDSLRTSCMLLWNALHTNSIKNRLNFSELFDKGCVNGMIILFPFAASKPFEWSFCACSMRSKQLVAAL